MLRPILAPIFLLSTVLTGSAGASAVDAAARAYFSEHLVGKRFALEKSGIMADGKISYDFKRTRSYSPIEVTDDGFRYRFSWQIEQTNFDFVDGQRIGDGFVKDRLGVSECNVMNSKAVPGVMFGFCRVLFNTLVDSNASVTRLRIAITEDGLQTTEMSMGDCFASGDTYFLCESENKSTYAPDADGKISITEAWQSFKLDPETLQRVPGEPDSAATDVNIQL